MTVALIEAHSADSAGLSRFAKMAEQIQRRFDESVDNPRHFEKVQWFARYWNGSINIAHPDLVLITGPGIDTSATWGA